MFNDAMVRLMVSNRDDRYRRTVSINRINQLQLLNIVGRLHLRMPNEFDVLFRKSIRFLVRKSILLREGLPTLMVGSRT